MYRLKEDRKIVAKRRGRKVRIKSIRATQPKASGDPHDWRTWLGQIAVTVETDDGLTGHGVGGGGKAGIHVIETALSRLLVGADATNVEVLWEDMYTATRVFGRKGIAMMAISGLDLALWDIRGRREGKPVAAILGEQVGHARKKIGCYKTGFSADEVIRNGAQGFGALKFHAGINPNQEVGDIVGPIRRVREALGPDVQLMADAGMKLDLDTALRLTEALDDCNLAWFEEPLPPEDLEGYAQLRDQSPIPIAGGEHEYTAAAFDVLMRERLHAIVQPDVTWCGGLTELVKIYEMGEKYGVPVCPHRGSEIWSLHAMASIDPDPLAESGRPWIDWIEGQPEIINGEIAIEDTPGFGVNLPS